MLAGIPAIMSEYCSQPGGVGDLILADFSRFVLSMREKLRAEVSIRLRFVTNEQAFQNLIPLNGNQPTSPCVAPRSSTGQRSSEIDVANPDGCLEELSSQVITYVVTGHQGVLEGARRGGR
jgi:hypothetical protein